MKSVISGLRGRLLIPCLAVLFALGCSSSTLIDSSLGIEDAPDWVDQGTQAVSDEDGRYIQGIGMAPPMGDLALQRTTAENRARAEIARVLSTFVDSTMNDYIGQSGDATSSSVDRTIRSTTQLALSGAKVIGHWKSPETGNLFAFARMDMKSFDQSLQQGDAMTERFKRYMQSQGYQKFDRFATGRTQ